MLPTIFTEKTSKTIVSCEASSKFHSTSFQNDRFVRGFLEISKNKLPKRAFRAMLLTIFTAQARKTSVSRDASDHFHRKSFQNDRFVRGFLEISKNKLPKRAFRAMLPTIPEYALLKRLNTKRFFQQWAYKSTEMSHLLKQRGTICVDFGL